jgi:hypothetical protein
MKNSDDSFTEVGLGCRGGELPLCPSSLPTTRVPDEVNTPMTWRFAFFKLRWLGLVLTLLTLSACGSRRPALYPVHGKVFFDGRPAAGARVVFHAIRQADPNIPNPSGTVRGDGSFSLGTFAPDDGAPSGDYNVAVVWLVSPSPAASQKGDVTNRLPDRYAHPQTSQLQAEVKDRPTELEPFKLTK